MHSAATAHFVKLFTDGSRRHVEACLSWLKPGRMSLPAYDTLLHAADISFVRLPQWVKYRARVAEILSATTPHVG